MATLTGQPIDQSYSGLLKTEDNGVIGAVAKGITDGVGGVTNMTIATTATNFVSGTVDFTGATVSGLPAGTNTTYDLAAVASGANIDLNLTGSDATTDTVSIVAGTNITLSEAAGIVTIDAAGGGGAAGLESGTGADSMQSAASLTTTAADAAGAETIALGQSAQAGGANTISIGSAIASNSNTQNSVNIGKNLTSNNASSDGTVNIGNGNVTNSGRTVAIGYDVDITSGQGQAIGNDIDIAGADRSTAIGSGIVINSTGSDKIGIGTTMTLSSDRAIGIGRDVIVSGLEAIAIGGSTNATATNSVALGEGVTAATADTVSVKALETQTNSTPTAGGIIMSDAGGTDRRLNIDTDGNLQVDSNTVNKAFSTARYAGVQGDFTCDTIQSSVLIPAGTYKAGDILQFNAMESGDSGTGWIYTAFWISTVGTIGQSGNDQMNLGQAQTSSASWWQSYQKTIYVHSNDGTGAGSTVWAGTQPSDVYNSSITTAGDPPVTRTPDWSVDQYLVSRICIDNSGTNYVNHGAVIRKIN